MDRITIVFLVVVAILVGIIFVVKSGHARSSEGVVTINDYEATISKGDTLVLTSTSGKTTNYWKVTYDGDQTVTAEQYSNFFPSSYSERLCGMGCSKEMGMGWLRHITIIERPDRRVSVQWPWGWGYRRHQ